MTERIQEFIDSEGWDKRVIREKQADVGEILLAGSRHMGGVNFERLSTVDLERMFELYDEMFFGGMLGEMVREQSKVGVKFRMSNRLTRSAGKTRRMVKGEGRRKEDVRYEIVIGAGMLLDNFGEGRREAKACGLVCENRLEGLQRVFEHELGHLFEMLVWERSSCKQARFKGLVGKWFGHLEATHELMTRREAVLRAYEVEIGDWVWFEFEGRRVEGRVNRITRRATVLAPSRDGRLYSDGRRYEKYYVGVGDLMRVAL